MHSSSGLSTQGRHTFCLVWQRLFPQFCFSSAFLPAAQSGWFCASSPHSEDAKVLRHGSNGQGAKNYKSV